MKPKGVAVRMWKVDNVNGSEDNISVITPFNPDDKDNFWVDCHPETRDSYQVNVLTDQELADLNFANFKLGFEMARENYCHDVDVFENKYTTAEQAWQVFKGKGDG